MPLTAITTAPLDHDALVRELDTTGIGAVAVFHGLVRDHNLGRRVLHLEYEAYEPLALRGLASPISGDGDGETVSRFGFIRTHHRARILRRRRGLAERTGG